jgi:hypothetical protein
MFLRWRGSGGVNVCDDEGQHLSELTHGQDSGGEAARLETASRTTTQSALPWKRLD